MKGVTLCLAYYENAGMLREQLKVWSAYAQDLKLNLDVIVVDDGSPTKPAIEALKPVVPVVFFSLYRVKVDIRWNQDACRNIAAHHARMPWLILTDIDHMIPEATLRALMTVKHDPEKVYRFSRVSAPEMKPYKPHPNSWFMTRRMFDRIGGYDERYAGFYGTDAMFRAGVAREAEIETLKEVLIRVPREVIPDASTTTYLRKQEEDRTEIPRIKAEIAASGDLAPRRLTFPYERVI